MIKKLLNSSWEIVLFLWRKLFDLKIFFPNFREIIGQVFEKKLVNFSKNVHSLKFLNKNFFIHQIILQHWRKDVAIRSADGKYYVYVL